MALLLRQALRSPAPGQAVRALTVRNFGVSADEATVRLTAVLEKMEKVFARDCFCLPGLRRMHATFVVEPTATSLV